MKRRYVIVLAVLAALVALVPGPAQTDTAVVGYGQHTEGPTKVLALPTGPVVLGPLTASFSVTEDSAMCAVGEVGGQVGFFNMLVYATDIPVRTSGLDPVTGAPTLTLMGTARSITMIAGSVVEDALTPFSATASDSGLSPAPKGDYFHISIDTSLWPHTTFGRDLDGNPLPLFAGDVAFAPRTPAAPGQ